MVNREKDRCWRRILSVLIQYLNHYNSQDWAKLTPGAKSSILCHACIEKSKFLSQHLPPTRCILIGTKNRSAEFRDIHSVGSKTGSGHPKWYLNYCVDYCSLCSIFSVLVSISPSNICSFSSLVCYWIFKIYFLTPLNT